MLSYNIHAGISYHHYGHYLTRSWRHLMPHGARWWNLDRIAGCLTGFDVVVLQESDAGSRPRRRIDHILVTPEIRMRRSFVPPWHHSDHLPIAMEVILPAPI